MPYTALQPTSKPSRPRFEDDYMPSLHGTLYQTQSAIKPRSSVGLLMMPWAFQFSTEASGPT
jgi:hypothetical protein